MADSRLETSLHPVHDLALLPSACVPVKRLRTNERQTRVISQKQLAQWASHASLSIPFFFLFFLGKKKYMILDSINLGRGRCVDWLMY